MEAVTTYAQLVEILTNGGAKRPDPPSSFPDVGLTHETWHVAGKVYELQAYGENQTGSWTLTAGVPKPQQAVEYPGIPESGLFT